MSISIPQESKLDTGSLAFDLLNDRGEQVQSLTHSGYISSFHLPSAKAFRVRMSGKTATGLPFTRLSDDEIKPKYAAIRTKVLSSIFSVRHGVSSPFTAVIDYTGEGSKTFTVEVFASINLHIVTRNSITVKSGLPAEIAMDLIAPYRTPVNKIIRLSIQARSGDLVLDLSVQLIVT